MHGFVCAVRFRPQAGPSAAADPCKAPYGADWLYSAVFDNGVAAEMREQERVVTKVEFHGIRASVPSRK